jgi:short-subunit dehydrogenase
VVGLSEAVRAELDETEIEISCVMPAVVNTELASGLKEARGVKNLEPEDVADAIVDALETARFDVWVPRSTQYIATVMNNKVLAEADGAARAAYEDRAAHSDPGLEPEGEKVSAKSD